MSSRCARACVMAESSSPNWCALTVIRIGWRPKMCGQPEVPGLSASVLRALREDQPSPHELTAAYQRFERRAPRRATALVVVSRWLAAGLAMGLGIAFGAEA